MEQKSMVRQDRKRSDYDSDVKMSTYLMKSYHGGDDLLDDKSIKYIEKYPLESRPRYTARKKRATVINLFQYFIDIYTDAIFSQEIGTGAVKNEKITRFIGSCNPSGETLAAFLRMVSVFSEFLNVAIFVDNFSDEQKRVLFDIEDPATIDKNVKERHRIFPFVQMLFPEKIIDLNEDLFGRLNWIVLDVSYVKKDDYFADQELVTARLYYDKEKSRVGIVKSGSVTWQQEVYHNLGVVPVIYLECQNQKKWCNVADIQRRIVNWLSIIDEMYLFSLFGFLAVEKTRDGNEKIKQALNSQTNGKAVVEFENKAPQWIDKDLTNIPVIWEGIKELIRYVKFLTGVDVDDEHGVFAKSAKSKEYSRKSLEETLKNKSNRLQQVATQILQIVDAWEDAKLSDSEQIDFPDKFDLETVQEKLETIENGIALFYSVESMVGHLLEKGVSLISPDLDKKHPKLHKRILDEIQKRKAEPTFNEGKKEDPMDTRVS
jgi:molecular chaperone GrpE (heat shock protein)